jgi:hypothetical protein
MWIDPLGKLDNHLKVSNTLQIESFVVAEWNMNDTENLDKYGTYRYRPTSSASSIYYNLPLNYDPLDLGDFYTDAEKSIYTFSDFVTDEDEPVLFESSDVNRELYFSLKSCFDLFRPRSGINKVLYFENKYIDNIRSARRPRYYLSSRYDNFKYWNSFRNQIENDVVVQTGVSLNSNPAPFTNDIGYIIEDTCPFAVYKKPVPTNRIVLKIQTNLSETSRGNIRTENGLTIPDPLGDRTKSSIPRRFKIEYLDLDDNWITAASFNENSTRVDGSEIFSWDGYLELYYGIKVPDQYRQTFHFVDYLDNINNLPTFGLAGESYIVGGTNEDPGTLYIWNDATADWDLSSPDYGFSISETDDTKRIGMIKHLVDPPYFISSGQTIFREIAFVKGLRVVIETMQSPDKTFDLIEMSPRLVANLSDYSESFTFVKSISNDSTGLPVGGLLASTGDISIFNPDGAFTEKNYDPLTQTGLFSNNNGSLVARYLKPHIKIVFYEAILNVDGYDKFIPMKTMYAENFPPSSGGMSSISLQMRDQFFRLETTRAPSILLTDTTLSSAVSILLDNIGFSNYVFKGFDDLVRQDVPQTELQYYASINDPVIPYFYVDPDISVAQALVNLAISTQTAMFFDEYNNFVVMPKEYLLPDADKRPSNLTFYGQTQAEQNQVVLPNIVNINNSETKILNDGTIKYSIKYIQKSISSLSQASFIDEDKIYVYKPVLLWEVGQNPLNKTQNNDSQGKSGYSLSAAPLNTTLTASVPYVVGNQIDPATINIDLGENVYWLSRFQGYLYANGEIIRYDAIEYDISGSGRVWITSSQQYQKYFSSLPFNGKIYPTGNVRIFSEPYYVTYEGAPATESLEENVTFKNGPVSRHGRGQFGTEVVDHPAGLSSYWSDNNNVRGLKMESQYIFSTTPTEQISYPATTPLGPPVGVRNDIAQQSTRNGIIKNFLRRTVPSDDIVKTLRSTSSGTIQSSALVFSGTKNIPSEINKRDFISYIYRPLDSAFRHFGTRMRIIGKLETNGKIQSPIDSSPYFNIQPKNTSDTVNINGGSGGLAIGVNPETNYGYYYEICSLTSDNLFQYITTNKETGKLETVLHNIIFYKIVPSGAFAVPKKLWGGLSKIIVDEGRFAGQDRLGNEENPTVYDLSVEYESIGSTRRFYLYLNGSQIAFVDDSDPLPEYTNMAVFVRGSSEAMFENVYALQSLMSKNTGETVINQVADQFGTNEITNSGALRKYGISGFIKDTYLTGVSPQHAPKYKIYFEEFGTIMREAAYFNIRYDQAYPALIAQIAPTFNNERGYSISGFYAGSYGAEFLIFNNTDKTIVLDETTGNYLRILGVSFTQNTTEELKVDDFFKERSNFSDPIISNGLIRSPIIQDKIYENIKSSRARNGKQEFNLEATYIQSYDDAQSLMQWLTQKTLRPRKIIEIEAFGVPHLQLGDIVNIDYVLPEGLDFVNKLQQFVVSEINYNRTPDGVSSTVKVVEV